MVVVNKMWVETSEKGKEEYKYKNNHRDNGFTKG